MKTADSVKDSLTPLILQFDTISTGKLAQV